MKYSILNQEEKITKGCLQKSQWVRAKSILFKSIMFSSLLFFFANTSLYAVRLSASHDVSMPPEGPVSNKKAFSPKLKLNNPKGKNAVYFNFDHSALPAGLTASNIAKATFEVYVKKAKKRGLVSVMPIVTKWSESDIAAPRLSESRSVTGEILGQKQYVSFDVTEIVRAWFSGEIPNEGLAIKANVDGAFAIFDSKEDRSTGHPATLEIALVDSGPQGTQGEQGPQGVTGPVGPTGEQGAVGAQGEQGLTGPQGPIGVTGAVGPQGVTGPAGPVPTVNSVSTFTLSPSVPASVQVTDLGGGVFDYTFNIPQGAQGVTGPQGEQGLTGPQGPVGATGPIGPVGPQGLTGPQGPVGATGPIGLTGATGPQGPIGLTGASGATGPAGATGPQGPIGPTPNITVGNVNTTTGAAGSLANVNVTSGAANGVFNFTFTIPKGNPGNDASISSAYFHSTVIQTNRSITNFQYVTFEKPQIGPSGSGWVTSTQPGYAAPTSFTVPTSGFYLVDFKVDVRSGSGSSPSSNNNSALAATVNGVQIPGSVTLVEAPESNHIYTLANTVLCHFNTGDIISLMFWSSDIGAFVGDPTKLTGKLPSGVVPTEATATIRLSGIAKD